MTPGADVQAIDALQDWHNALCLFRDEALDALGSIGLEIRRAYDWIDEERKAWQHEAQEAETAVVQAKAELNQRKTPDFGGRVPDTSVQERALARARARLQHAEEQIEVCRKWATRLPKLISEDYEGPARRLSTFLDTDVPRAIADLGSRIEALHRYTQVQPVSAPPAPAAPEAPT
jgi:hypothetical protein